MKKRILGLDIGTNSIGWALVEQDFDKKQGKITDAGSRIIPMDQNQLTDFEKGNTVSATAQRTAYRGVRRLYQRDNLRRERLHRVLNVLGFLPEHYKNQIDFIKKKGQFIKEVKLNYRKNEAEKYEFIFMDSFQEMADEFKLKGIDKIPYDWTLYYLRKKALKEKISKEELAWVLLNFNQKRGYYQLRGEEEEQKEGKTKTFEVLKVEKVVDSGETIKGKDDKLYDIYFTNGWKYDKQTTKPEQWIGKTKEFIVTTTEKKDGEPKRTFKTVDSEKDWSAIKAKTEQELEKYIGDDYKNKTVGTFIYEKLLENPHQKIRGKLIKTIERKFYKKELEAILDKQTAFHPELQNIDLYKACITELYSRNEAHQKSLLSHKDRFKHLFINDIIFYQRPLKSQKGNIGGCQYEKRPQKDKNGNLLRDDNGNPILKPVKVTSKSNPLFQEFRLWQWLHNLKIYANEKEVDGKIKQDVEVTAELLPTEEARVELFDYLTTKKEVDLAGFLKYFSDKKLINKQKKDNYTHRWNYPVDKKYPMYETRYGILSRLTKVEGLTNPNEFLTKEVEKHLWHIIYSVSDAKEFEQALKTFAGKYDLDTDSFVENFKKMPPYKSDFASYSEKAIKKLLPLMRMGKYWGEAEIPQVVKERIQSIMERVNALDLPENPTKKQITDAFEKHQVTDDDIPRQIVKSFIPFVNINPLKGLNTYQAGYAVYGRHSESGNLQYWKSPQDIDDYLHHFKQHSLRNPIVEQIVLETLRTVRDIWKNYGEGKEGFFDEIHLELGRELRNPADKRKKISQKNAENERTNQRIRALLNELTNEGAKPFSPNHQEILKIYEDGIYQNPNADFSKVSEDDIKKIRKNPKPSHNDIVRYKLWLQQGYISPYTGKPISLSDLFTEKYQIEHIIPQSRYFDNSMNNKVICESAVNELKSNQTAYEFINDKGGYKVDLGNGKTVDILTFDKYQSHCNQYFKKNKQKLKNLLAEEIPDGFISRQMNDSRYISKFVKYLLSNIVREEGEQEPTAKRLLPVTGSITTKLKQDWGLNDKWNELILPRFKRLNELTQTQDFTYLNEQGIEVPTVPDELRAGFNKKRIDHRHHAMDAIVIAACTREHINYINALNSERKNFALVNKLRRTEEIEKIDKKTGERKKIKIAKEFIKPWENFPVDAEKVLQKTIVSFKKNTRILTKTNNKYWKYIQQKDGSYKKELVKQAGDNRAIRKPLHTPKPYGKKMYDFSVLEISKNVGKRDLIIDDKIRVEVEKVFSKFGKIGPTSKELKKNPITDEKGNVIKFCAFKVPGIRFRKRQPITKLSDRSNQNGIKTKEQAVKFINKISDKIIREDLLNYLKENDYDIDRAFSVEGIEEFNKRRKIPVYKLPIAETSTDKFQLGYKKEINKKKFGEAEGGTNLFFNIYINNKGERVYETVPLNEVITHQKWRAGLPEEEQKNIPMVPVKNIIKDKEVNFLFSLSPNDLVYVPTDEEIENPDLFDFDNLTEQQIERIFVVNDFSSAIYFTPNHLAKNIAPKEVDLSIDNKNGKLKGSFDTKTASYHGVQIKEVCWKLKINRLGNITKVEK